MKKEQLILRQFEIGPMQNFQYFLGDTTTNEIAIVDPAWDVDFLLQKAQEENFTIRAVWLTHGHPDHTNGLKHLLKIMPDIPIFISKHELSVLKSATKNLKEVAPKEKLKIGHIEFTCLYTPGHSPGCHCFYVPGHLISGDTLFIDGCGRCDLPGSDPRQMYDSLYNTIMKLPEDTLIYPGHNYGHVEIDSLKNQKRSNPYLQCGSLDEFLSDRM